MNKFLNLVSLISIIILSSCKLNNPVDPNYTLTINDFSVKDLRLLKILREMIIHGLPLSIITPSFIINIDLHNLVTSFIL